MDQYSAILATRAIVVAGLGIETNRQSLEGLAPPGERLYAGAGAIARPGERGVQT